jgi:hypothetical protein
MILNLSTNDALPIIGIVLPAPTVVTMTGFVGFQGPPGEPGTIVHVGPTPPIDPSINDLWVDTT